MAVSARVLTIPELESEPGFLHAFSTMVLGSVGLSHAPDPAPVLASRRDFARALGIDEEMTVVGAIHGSTVARVDEPQGVVQGVDALITNQRGVTLFATFADCYPILLWDPVQRCAALAHAGWRGTVARVGPAAVQAMAKEYGSKPSNIRAGIGPGICGRCYEVGEDVASRFDPRFVTAGNEDRFLLDLAAANRSQLEDAGLKEVHVLGLCTKESAFLPSHRRDPDGTRFGAIVALR
ncbi:MAG: purine-nucleoside/S-methyl-5-thioadenosine phosphorylase / adenosine deaminase [Chloroflexota bacterium]|nr:purine-nucleoside/S-methyl-5-thioadenosine phosphorylase / adenosine deaminase [Chloroflexota bacterium]